MQCLQTRIRTSVRCSAPARCVRYAVHVQVSEDCKLRLLAELIAKHISS